MSIQGAVNSVIGGAERSIGIMKFFQNEEIRSAENNVQTKLNRVSELNKGAEEWLNDNADNPQAHMQGRNKKGQFVSDTPYTIMAENWAKYDIAQGVLEKQKDVLANMPTYSLFGRAKILGKVNKEVKKTMEDIK